MLETRVHLFQSPVDLVKAGFDMLETRVHLFQSPVDLIEAASTFNLLKTSVDLPEAYVDSGESISDRLSLREKFILNARQLLMHITILPYRRRDIGIRFG